MRSWLLLVVLAVAPLVAQEAETYRVEAGPALTATLELDWHDTARGRDVPVRVWYPVLAPGAAAEPCPVVVFSHGLGGSRYSYAVWGSHWASWGYVVVMVQHLGSDDAIWRDAGGPAQAYAALRRAAMQPANLIARPYDVAFALDQLAVLNENAGPLRGRIDQERVGLAGHSFGAYTTLAGVGLRLPALAAAMGPVDERPRAAIAMSSPHFPRGDFSAVAVPVLHLTGELDESPIGGTGADQRRTAFDRITAAGGALVDFVHADHMVFSGQRRQGDANHDQAIQDACRQLTTAFWDCWLRDDEAARAWLYDGPAAAMLGASARLQLTAAAE